MMLIVIRPAKAGITDELQYPETYLQYVPVVFMLGAAELGAHSEHQFVDRTVNVACTYIVQIAVTRTLKWSVNEQRPDGSAWNSFPSGHSAAAFAGAEMIRQEYGWGWGALFYASAAATATLRVVHNRHWWWDTLAGAVIGVGSAHLGRFATDKLMVYFTPNSVGVTYTF